MKREEGVMTGSQKEHIKLWRWKLPENKSAMEMVKEEKEEMDRKVSQMEKGKEKLEEELRETG